MAVNSADYSSPFSQDTSRGPSQSIWSQFQIADAQQDRGGGTGGGGIEVWDDFCPVPSISTGAAIGTVGQWAAWLGSGSTLLDGVEEGGVVKINGTTDDKAVILTSNAGAFRFMGASTAYTFNPAKFGMEFRIALGNVSTTNLHGIFIGLADNTSSQINSVDTTILAAGGTAFTSTKNIMGFYKAPTTASQTGYSLADWGFAYQPASGTAVYPSALATLVTTVTGSAMSAYAASTDVGKGTGFVKIGMVYDPSPGLPAQVIPASPPTGMTAGNLAKPVLRFYVNGQLCGQFISRDVMAAATFPLTSVYSPVICYLNQGASAPIYLDWVRFYQQASF